MCVYGIWVDIHMWCGWVTYMECVCGVCVYVYCVWKSMYIKLCVCTLVGAHTRFLEHILI